jgi:predicted Zn finger-like uncharacterized protein
MLEDETETDVPMVDVVTSDEEAHHDEDSTTITESATRTAGPNRRDMSHQSDYGASQPYPETFVRCGKCQTNFAIAPSDLGGPKSKGRRLTCSVCDHTWFQSKERIMTIREGFEMSPLPEEELERIALNIREGKKPSFVGAMKLYVGNIAFESSEDDLMEIFSTVGDVGEVSLVRDEITGRIRGFGFVTMRTKEGGLKAIEELNGVAINGRSMAVRESTN